MSNPESFIDEVTEEVRRDRLFALLRRYGWIGVVAVLALVGGAAWNEITKAQAIARAQAFGDGVLAALEAPDPAARRAALSAVPATGAQAALRDLMLASDPEADRAATLAALAAVAAGLNFGATLRPYPSLHLLFRSIAIRSWGRACSLTRHRMSDTEKQKKPILTAPPRPRWKRPDGGPLRQARRRRPRRA